MRGLSVVHTSIAPLCMAPLGWQGIQWCPEGYTQAGRHPREVERMKVLHSLGIEEIVSLDQEQLRRSVGLKNLRDICETAANIYNADTAYVTLVGEETTWVLAGYGPNGDVREGSRPDSVCGHCVTQEWDGIEIPDFLETNEFAKNPAAVFGGIRYYASFLISDPVSKLPLGTLCVLHSNPMVAAPWQRRTLMLLARQVALTLQLRHEIFQVDEVVHSLERSREAVNQSLHLLQEASLAGRDVLTLLIDNDRDRSSHPTL